MRRIHLCIIYSILIAVVCTILLASATLLNRDKAFARCPNGTHISPSVDCEVVVASTGLSRCPNGSHRSPSGACEQVVSNSFNGNSGGSNNVSTFNIAENPFINGTNSNNSPPILSNSTNATNMMVQSFNAPQLTTSPLAVNHTLDQYCDSPGHPSCYSVGFEAGRSAPGTSCPIAYSFAFCEGYHIGSGTDIIDKSAQINGIALSYYLHHFPTSIGILRIPANIFTILGPAKLQSSNTTSATNNMTKSPSTIP
jgi:hypothetical protein